MKHAIELFKRILTDQNFGTLKNCPELFSVIKELKKTLAHELFDDDWLPVKEKFQEFQQEFPTIELCRQTDEHRDFLSYEIKINGMLVVLVTDQDL